MSAAPETLANGSSEEEDYISQLTKDGPVELRAYGHQVGGHSLLMKFGKAICKPMLPRERFFYATLSQDLRRFTPAYYGVVSIRFKLTEDGRVHLLATGNGIGNRHSPGMGNGGTETWVSGDGTEEEAVETPSVTPPIVRLDFIKATAGFNGLKHEEIVKASNGYFSNPWSTACMTNMQAILAHFGASQLQEFFQDYLVLEDLTCKFERPCIMDLKMGTRRHGDDQSEEKKRKHMERCASTTSAQLGVSMAGVQVYNASRGVYTFKDKYYCRELSTQSFHEELRQFVHSGLSLRTDIISALVHRLCQLRDVISQQESFRFFSSSLLIVYDGRLEERSTPDLDHKKSHVEEGDRMVEDEEAGEFSEVSTGSEVGDGGRGGGGERCEGGEGRRGSRLEAGSEPVCKGHGVSGCRVSQTTEEAKRLVDIRMIDFAHATHARCKNDPVKYSGPDKGYITGLNTLISAFQSMQEEN